MAVLVASAGAAPLLRHMVADNPRLATAGTVFCGVFVQAFPFLVLGIVLSGFIATFVTADLVARWLPRRPALAVVVAAIAGIALPGCECGSVPVARRLYGEQDAAGASALAFMLAAPAINPVVLVSTAVAFPGVPAMVGARAAASLATAVIVGWVWSRWGRPAWVTADLPDTGCRTDSRTRVFVEAARHDFLHAGSYLVLGAAAAAALHAFVPRGLFENLPGHLVWGIAVMAVLAVVLALCSEADAFVAAGMGMVPLLPRLVFLVVGPAVDLKLFAMQVGMFGRSFAIRFAPLTFAVAVGSATAVGLLVLGGR